jgi:hypothetical protein
MITSPNLFERRAVKRLISDVLRAFHSGDLNAPTAKTTLLSYFAAFTTPNREVIAQRYIDEILANIDSGDISVTLAAEGLEESIAASHVLPNSTFD